MSAEINEIKSAKAHIRWKDLSKREELSKKLKDVYKSRNYYGKNNPMYGRCAYDIWVEKYGKEIADEKKEKLIKEYSFKMKGRKNSLETREKMKIAALNLKKLICPYCGKSCDPGNSKKYHFDNCKYKMENINEIKCT